MMHLPLVVIIVLNWNGKDDTLACLESLQQITYASFDTLVVDNGSTDGSVLAIRACFPHQSVIETGKNLGYARGNNVGLRHALAQGADYALLLNNDTVADPTFLCSLVEALEASPSAGIAGPTIYYHVRPDVIWSAGGAIDWKRGSTRMVGLDEQDVGQFGEQPREVDFVTGCALLVRTKAVEEAGELDERFFMYYEEAEWCVRIARAGYRIVHVPQSKVWHKISPGAQADSPLIHYYMTRNRLLFLRSTRSGVRAWYHTLLAEYLRTLISWTVKPCWRDRHAQRRAMVEAIADFARGRFGLTPRYSSQNL